MEIILRVLLLFQLIFISLCQCQRNTNSNLDLYYHLLDPSRYIPKIIPICGKQEKVTVKIEMALRDIVEVKEKQQLIRLKIWVRLKWRDCKLQWDPSQYKNQTELIVPYSEIWIPDITLYEGVSDEGNMPDMDDYRASISHTGDVTYNFPSIVTVVCKFNVAYFPFDHQMCSMKFGSWIYSGRNIDLEKIKDKVDVSSFRKHNEWNVVETAAVRHNIYYGCCPDPYPDVTFHIHIRRNPLFYVITIIFPCSLINLLSFMGFVLPPFSGEKISIPITVLLSTTVFLLLVQDKFPSASEDFPLLAMYFAICMLLVCISCVFSSIVLHVYNKSPEEHQISPLFRTIFLDKVRKIMCVKFDKVIREDELVQIKDIRYLDKEPKDIIQQQCVEIRKEEPYLGRKLSFGKGEIPEYSHENNVHAYYDHQKGHITNEWELFACILDRFFMFAYLCLALTNCVVFTVIMINYEGQDIPM
ncbi:acetylcholine receptor subunit alpha-like 2 [Saccostrea echinata]|uniref:acetylcholine receptor subunit alpha-like 2 n=1 Tax=Saccostrea echinata TaxID=191078 RepID=UPI002A838461|nr:acetylcholine receptor subunit alpha-like 2 [Saccostrea echinata]